MIFKILLPALATLIVYLLGKNHARREQRLNSPATSKTIPEMEKKDKSQLRLAAYMLAFSTIGLAGWYIYDDWSQSKQEVLIRIINAETGKVSSYKAIKGQIHGQTFRTTDGRQVRLADVERMEIEFPLK